MGWGLVVQVGMRVRGTAGRQCGVGGGDGMSEGATGELHCSWDAKAYW